MRDAQKQFSKITVALHWLVALGMVALLSVGIFMAETETYFLYPIHKSIGVLMFGLILARVVWRLINGWPVPVGDYQHWEHVLAKLIHWVLILGTLLMPISGMLMSGAGGHGIAVFGFELLAMNPDPNDAHAVIALNKTLAGLGHEIHEWLAYILIASIALHIAGALKHHVLDKDGTLRRMLGKAI